MSIGKRLKEVRTHLKLTQEKFAKPLSITRGYIASIENDLQEPSDALLKLISAEYGISVAWLKTGEGEMFISPEEAIKNQMARFDKQAFIEALKNFMESEYVVREKKYLYIREGNGDPELRRMVKTLQDIWATGDERLRSWVAVQFDFAFPKHAIEAALKKRIDEKEKKEPAVKEDIPLQRKRITGKRKFEYYEDPAVTQKPESHRTLPHYNLDQNKQAEEKDDIDLDNIMVAAHAEGREILRPLSPELKAIVKDAIRVSREKRKKEEEETQR